MTTCKGTIEVKLIESNKKMDVKKDMGRCSLLDLLLHAKANVPFQCKQGYCGCCRTKLVSGEVRYTEDNMTFLKEGEILPCICQPVTDVEVCA